MNTPSITSCDTHTNQDLRQSIDAYRDQVCTLHRQDLNGLPEALSSRTHSFDYAVASYVHSSARQWIRGPEAHSLPWPSAGPDSACQPNLSVLLVEHRDEVFARIAADLSKHGLLVVRAATACEGLKVFDTHKPQLIVANVSLLDQSAWLLTAKLRLTEPPVPVWLYQPGSTPVDLQLADYLTVTELLNYGGDLLELSRQVVNRLAAGMHRCG